MLLYSTLGARWTYPIRITYSIVPDGTSIGGTPSNLQQTLNSKSGWQQQVQEAAAVWQAVAGINLVQVPDNGAPIGSSGNQQDDPGFGDIRIGGMPQSSSYLGFAYAPPKFNGGTNAGEILLNTAQSWQTDGTTYDLSTVLIHEFGHALGMGHSGIATADMYANYLGANQALSSDDIQGIQSIYGAPIDTTSNNSYTYATDITPYIDGNGQISLANLNINSSSDADWFKVTVPASSTGTMTIKMQSSILSSLSPQIQVYTASGRYLGGVSAPYSYGCTVGGSLGGVVPGQGYYIEVMAANNGPSSNGNFGLQVNFGSSPQAAIAPPNTVVAAQPDQNPSTTPMGTGWMVGGQFIPYLGVLGVLQGVPNIANGLYCITYGTLSGFGQPELAVGDPAGHSHHPGGGQGAGGTHNDGHHRHRDAPSPFDTSDTTDIPPAVDIGADPGQGGLDAFFQHRRGGQRRAEGARPQAVDAALSGWRPDGQIAASPAARRGHPSRSFRTATTRVVADRSLKLGP